jgi:hypothetical protein
MVDREDSQRIQALEERAVQRDREVVQLSSMASRLTATVEAIRTSLCCQSPPTLQPSNPPTLRRARPAPSAPAIEQHRTEISALKAPRYGFVSPIVADFPALFPEFRGKRFTLLWRGSRNGFRAWDFHDRCDGHAATPQPWH